MQPDIQVFRGPRVESAHEVAICIANDKGELVLKHGDVAQKAYPRSAVKIMQAMPLISSGAADRFKLDEKMLALACASHSGEPEHAEVARAMLERGGLSEADLMCGVHWPTHKSSAYALAGLGRSASALHNNCSGKHAGFLLYAKHKGYPTKDYVAPDHPVQRDLRALLEDLLAEKLQPDASAIDGCSIPTYAFSLSSMARGFAKLPKESAAQRLLSACAAQPFYTAGAGRFDTGVMEIFGARAYVKTGAEGVYIGVLPELKLGFALKCLDGATRAAECVTANIIDALLPMSDGERTQLAPLCTPVLKNWRGVEVGMIGLAKELHKVLSKIRP